MRKRLLLLTMFLFFLTANSLKAQFYAGGGFTLNAYFATLENSNADPGFWLRGGYDINSHWSGAGTVSFFFANPSFNRSNFLTSLDFDAHYRLVQDGSWNVYGLAGLNILIIRRTTTILNTDSKVTSSDVRGGFNLGAGAAYRISDRLSIPLEMRLVFTNPVRYNLLIGALYHFGG